MVCAVCQYLPTRYPSLVITLLSSLFRAINGIVFRLYSSFETKCIDRCELFITGSVKLSRRTSVKLLQ